MPDESLTPAEGTFSGQVAVVTGGSKGLGQFLAEALARAGASVVIMGRDRPRLDEAARGIEGQGGKVLPLACDVSDAEAVTLAIQRAQASFGPIDLLVNNAGEGGPIEKAWRVDPAAWRHTFETNLFGSFHCMHAVLPQMVERRRGIIVNMASHAGVHRWPTCSAYAVSKSALIKLTENLAAETQRQGVSIFAYHPGFLAIGMNGPTDPSQLKPGSPAERVMSWALEQVRNGNVTPPERCLAQFMQLASGRYPHLSGCYLTVDDDLEAISARLTGATDKSDLHRLGLLKS